MAICQRCKAQNREGTRFCTSCGAPMGAARQAPATGPSGGAPRPVNQGGYSNGGSYPNNGSRAPVPAQQYPRGTSVPPRPQSFFSTDPMSVGTCAGMMVLTVFFPVGVIIAFVYGYGENTARDFKMFCRYYLLFSPIGFIMALVYAFGSETDYMLKTISKGFLALLLFVVILWFLAGFSIFATLGSLLGGGGY